MWQTMYRFSSSLPPATLKARYLKKYNLNLLQQKFENLKAQYPNLFAALPADISARKLLICPFDYLAKVYFSYKNFVASLTEAEQDNVNNALKGIFKYSSHSSKIRDFLVDPTNELEIYNCVYCDLESVRVQIMPDGTKKREFDTEHVLDKGECPLVALSLYNFVPSCRTCNGLNYKGTNPVGGTESEVVKLSPTSFGYDFAGQSRFVVNPKNPDFDDLVSQKHPEDYEIDIIFKDPIYKVSSNLFGLITRYNERVVLVDMLKYRDKARSNPLNIVRQFAEIKGCTIEEMYNELFEFDLRRREHYPMEKARRDIMLQ